MQVIVPVHASRAEEGFGLRVAGVWSEEDTTGDCSLHGTARTKLAYNRVCIGFYASLGAGGRKPALKLVENLMPIPPAPS